MSDLSRREFLQLGGVLVASQTLSLDSEIPSALRQQVAPSDRIRFGIIGVGMQGQALLSNSIALPGVECAAACDLYDGRHTLAREIAGTKVVTTRRYQDILNDKDIDCVLAAVPDHWHKQIVIDILGAGKDVYCEKPMSHSAAEGVSMVLAAERSGKIVQIGSQRVSSEICTTARDLLTDGIVGDLTLVEASLGRNDPSGAWEYPLPPDLSPRTIDWDTWQGSVPKRPFDPKIFARWRCWREYGTGVAGDLLVHLVSGMLYMLQLNEPPRHAMAMGGILRWNDGRDMPDVHCTLFDYRGVPVYMRLNLGCETPETYRFMGSKGILQVTENEIAYTPQSGDDSQPSYYTAGLPHDLREAYEKQWHLEHDPQPGKERSMKGISYKGVSWDQEKPHLWKFFQSVKSRQPVTEDARFGHHAALACHLANESYFRKKAVSWDAQSQEIKG